MQTRMHMYTLPAVLLMPLTIQQQHTYGASGPSPFATSSDGMVGDKRVEEMTVPEIKEELKKRGLKVAGVKAELQVC